MPFILFLITGKDMDANSKKYFLLLIQMFRY